uniref:Uncharacterized protein n=1 Tax=Oryza meridionalis TaxID=40149 RepID=A0A0E0DJV3_9ORYZ
MFTDCSSLTTQLSSAVTSGSSGGAVSLKGKDSSTATSVCSFSRCVLIASARKTLLAQAAAETHVSEREEETGSRRGRDETAYLVATVPTRGRCARRGRKAGGVGGGEQRVEGAAAAGSGEAEATAAMPRGNGSGAEAGGGREGEGKNRSWSGVLYLYLEIWIVGLEYIRAACTVWLRCLSRTRGVLERNGRLIVVPEKSGTHGGTAVVVAWSAEESPNRWAGAGKGAGSRRRSLIHRSLVGWDNRVVVCDNKERRKKT